MPSGASEGIPIAAAATLTEADPLDPVREALRAMAARPDLPALNGLAPGLTVADPTGWAPATGLTSGARLADFLDTAKQRWRVTGHIAAALAWKCYSYWVALPAVVGYAAARRVPLMRPEAVMVRWSPRQPFVAIGLTPAAVEVAVLPSDPLAAGGPGHPGRVRVVPDDDAMLTALSDSLRGSHLSPIVESIKARLHLGRRTLWGSVASGVAHGLSRAAEVIPEPALEMTNRVLVAMGVDDLVELERRPDDRPGLVVQRRTCCLAFALPEPRICAGCCIR